MKEETGNRKGIQNLACLVIIEVLEADRTKR